LKAVATELDGVLRLCGAPARDERGAFARVFDRDVLAAAGLVHEFPQWSTASNAAAGTLRGLHFNSPEHAETKLIRVVAGAVLDVLVDVRPDSPTVGRWAGFELHDDDGVTLFVPPGYAHGYQTLTDATTVLYAIGPGYVAEARRGINACDPALGISWPLPVRNVSERDRALPALADYLRDREGAAWNP
jgi:dTDP-4-dehydrorhamnose 3,5-epimerase